MTRLVRVVVSGLPHQVTQRNNRRESIFFEDDDREIYRDLLGEQVRKAEVEVCAYRLMPNHVHLILNPRQSDGLGRAVWFFGEDGRICVSPQPLTTLH